jgi:hypothetical protein
LIVVYDHDQCLQLRARKIVWWQQGVLVKCRCAACEGERRQREEERAKEQRRWEEWREREQKAQAERDAEFWRRNWETRPPNSTGVAPAEQDDNDEDEDSSRPVPGVQFVTKTEHPPTYYADGSWRTFRQTTFTYH